MPNLKPVCSPEEEWGSEDDKIKLSSIIPSRTPCVWENFAVCYLEYETRRPCLNRNAAPLSRKNVVFLRDKMRQPGTRMCSVVDVLVTQNGTLVAKDNVGLTPDRNSDDIPLIGIQMP